MRQEEPNIFAFFRDLFKLNTPVEKGDVGIYHYIWTCDTIHEDSHGLKYDVYAKVKAVGVYSNLIEVETLDIKINDSASQEIINLISKNFPKYVHPKYVKWEVKPKTQLFNKM
jgi:hypothetical protein